MAEKGEYRGFYVALPDDPEFQELSAEARAIFYPLKLKLGKAGIDVFYPEVLPRLTGYPFERVSKALQELVDSGWLIVEHNVFWIRNGLRFDPSDPLSSPNQRKGIVAHLKTLPKLAIVNEFALYYELTQPHVNSDPSRKGFERASEPLRSTEDGRRKTEDKDPPGVARERASPPIEVGSVSELDDEPLPLVPGDLGTRVSLTRPRFPPDVRVPFARQDWEGRTNGSVVLREWMNLQPVPPSRGDRDRFGMTCKRLSDDYTCGEIALGFLGMECLWPWAPPPEGKGEPWTPETLRKEFSRAIAAAQKHPVFESARMDQALDAALNGQGVWS